VDDSIGIGDLATILTVGGVTIYILGLIGLVIPIRRVFTGDLSAAWYAVALIPKTVVAGHGARIWLRLPVVITALALFATTLQALLPKTSAFLAVAIYLGALVYMWKRIVTPLRSEPPAEVAVSLVMVGVFLSWLLGSYPVISALYGLTGNQHLLPEIGIGTRVGWHVETTYHPLVSYLFVERSFIVNVLLLLIGGFFYGLPLAISASPPLPEVKVHFIKQEDDNEEENSNPLKGHLLAHADGFWHLFDGKNVLRSIPDAQVLDIRMSPPTTEEEEGS
jgi:hypothetical protein